mmetsp:Transcript_3060/g.11877  ORF Transcript_3060/g.11877 Transcript_3060/m.11877 type:complete len:450 (-) Transcript_3060:32-1381(-)
MQDGLFQLLPRGCIHLHLGQLLHTGVDMGDLHVALALLLHHLQAPLDLHLVVQVVLEVVSPILDVVVDGLVRRLGEVREFMHRGVLDDVLPTLRAPHLSLIDLTAELLRILLFHRLGISQLVRLLLLQPVQVLLPLLLLGDGSDSILLHPGQVSVQMVGLHDFKPGGPGGTARGARLAAVRTLGGRGGSAGPRRGGGRALAALLPTSAQECGVGLHLAVSPALQAQGQRVSRGRREGGRGLVVRPRGAALGHLDAFADVHLGRELEVDYAVADLQLPDLEVDGYGLSRCHGLAQQLQDGPHPHEEVLLRQRRREADRSFAEVELLDGGKRPVGDGRQRPRVQAVGAREGLGDLEVRPHLHLALRVLLYPPTDFAKVRHAQSLLLLEHCRNIAVEGIPAGLVVATFVGKGSSLLGNVPQKALERVHAVYRRMCPSGPMPRAARARPKNGA